MEAKKKSNKGFIVAIVILSLLLVGSVGYITYDKFLSKTNDKENSENKIEIKKEETESKEEILDIYSDQIQTLYDNIHIEDCGLEVRSFYEQNQVSLDSFKSIASSLSLRKLREKNGTLTSSGYRELNKFTYDEINNIAKEIFGKNFNLEEKDYGGCPVYNYDITTKTYTKPEGLGCGCGTTGPENPYYNMYKATKLGDEIHIYESVAYSKAINDDNGNYSYSKYYKDSARTIELSDCYEYNLLSKTCVDQSSKYEYIYTLEDDNYVITDIKKIS